MKWSVVAVLLALPLAGCLGDGGSSMSQAKAAAEASHQSAEGDHDYLLFLGITGTEGPLNWTAYEDALRASSDPGSSIADAFDQDVENGELGDGRLASWLTTHFVFDEERRLLGGLYTQYSPEHGIRTAYAPFRGPYVGTLALPNLQANAATSAHLAAAGTAMPQLQVMQDVLAARSGEETVLCALTSSTDSWGLDSRAAAALALERPIMRQHIEENPDGEFTYYYLPRLGVEEGCQASLDVASNHWLISHADLDAYLQGQAPSVAEVRIDAGTGEVLSESVRPLYVRPPVDLQDAISYQDSLLPLAPKTHAVEIAVPEGAARLDVHALRVEAPQWERDARSHLVDPEGDIVGTHSFAEPLHWYRVSLPAAGTWRLEYLHEPIEPEGVHEVSVRAMISFA